MPKLHDGQLIVDGKPFLILGGELGNSSASHLPLLKEYFEKLKSMHLNTVLVPVCWDQLEPNEGEFDYSLVRGAIDQARQVGLRLVLLWFGTWKNSMSCYAPSWVKRDQERFFRVLTLDGQAQEIVSPLCKEAQKADGIAFANLMRWLEGYDGSVGTVIMVQVENEIGMIPESRDFSTAANRAFAEGVPDELMNTLTSGTADPVVTSLWKEAGEIPSGSWNQVFGDSKEANEVFSAWFFARFTEAVTSAGKAEYDLPMFTNAALIRDGYEPGRYPAGGPLPHLATLWHVAAPSLDFLAPDIYFPNFTKWIDAYASTQATVFVPEIAPTERVAANALYAISACRSVGTCPFAIESMADEQRREITRLYGQLSHAEATVLDAQRNGSIFGATPRLSFDWVLESESEVIEIGSLRMHVRFDRAQTPGNDAESELPTHGSGRWNAPRGTPLGGVMIIQVADEEFLAFGRGVVITFSEPSSTIGIDWAREGEFVKGEWQPTRWLNGDQTHQGRHIHLSDSDWTWQRIGLYRY